MKKKDYYKMYYTRITLNSCVSRLFCSSRLRNQTVGLELRFGFCKLKTKTPQGHGGIRKWAEHVLHLAARYKPQLDFRATCSHENKWKDLGLNLLTAVRFYIACCRNDDVIKSSRNKTKKHELLLAKTKRLKYRVLDFSFYRRVTGTMHEKHFFLP